MSALSEQLDAIRAQSAERIPADTLSVMQGVTQELKESGIEDRAVKAGAKAPDFTLKNHLNEERTLSGLLDSGPVVLSFYRGGW